LRFPVFPPIFFHLPTPNLPEFKFEFSWDLVLPASRDPVFQALVPEVEGLVLVHSSFFPTLFFRAGASSGCTTGMPSRFCLEEVTPAPAFPFPPILIYSDTSTYSPPPISGRAPTLPVLLEIQASGRVGPPGPLHGFLFFPRWCTVLYFSMYEQSFPLGPGWSLRYHFEKRLLRMRPSPPRACEGRDPPPLWPKLSPGQPPFAPTKRTVAALFRQGIPGIANRQGWR